MVAPETKELLESGCGLVIGLTAPDGEPLAARGWGLDVLRGEQEFRVLLDAAINDIPWFGKGVHLAVTGADIATVHSAQLKGRIQRVEPVTQDDRDRAERHIEAFFTNVNQIDGTARELLERLVPVDFVACVVTLAEVYDQTPGPGAGASVGGAAR